MFDNGTTTIKRAYLPPWFVVPVLIINRQSTTYTEFFLTAVFTNSLTESELEHIQNTRIPPDKDPPANDLQPITFNTEKFTHHDLRL
jgi:hypothetical protein